MSGFVNWLNVNRNGAFYVEDLVIQIYDISIDRRVFLASSDLFIYLLLGY